MSEQIISLTDEDKKYIASHTATILLEIDCLRNNKTLEQATPVAVEAAYVKAINVSKKIRETFKKEKV